MLRILPAERGFAAWRKLERRFVMEGRWDWCLAVTDLILAEGAPIAAPGHPLKAALAASRISAIIHSEPGVDVAGGWREVEEAAALHPDLKQAAWLRGRAVAGQVAALAAAGQTIPDDLANRFAELLDSATRGTQSEKDTDERWNTEQLAAALTAAVEQLLEGAGADRKGSPLEPLSILNWAETLDPTSSASGLCAFARSLAARTEALGGGWDRAFDLLAEAMRTAGTSESPATGWLDWLPPARLADRLRLEFLRLHAGRFGLATVTQAQLLPEADSAVLGLWEVEASQHLQIIDCERLVSRILQVRGAYAPVPIEELDRLRSVEQYDSLRRPTCLAHRSAPLLVASLSRGLSDDGARRDRSQTDRSAD